MKEFFDVEITKQGQVATLRLLPSGDEHPKRHKWQSGQTKNYPKIHTEVGMALQELREDKEVRVIVLTGTDDIFFVPPSSSPWIEAHGDPGVDWDLSTGINKTLNLFIEMEKPIVAKVNGPAIGFGSSLVFACDFIIAKEDALIADHHLGMGELEYGRKDFGVCPGDGGAVFVPMYMSPALAKEYLLMARKTTGSELARMGTINYAVPGSELNATVDNFVERLLKRTPYALAWGKRVLNRRVSENMNLTFDSAWAYELLNFYMALDYSREKGGERGVSSL